MIDRLIFDVLSNMIKNFVIDWVVNIITINVVLINDEFVDVFNDF